MTTNARMHIGAYIFKIAGKAEVLSGRMSKHFAEEKFPFYRLLDNKHNVCYNGDTQRRREI